MCVYINGKVIEKKHSVEFWPYKDIEKISMLVEKEYNHQKCKFIMGNG
jgi:hypothetical protein